MNLETQHYVDHVMIQYWALFGKMWENAEKSDCDEIRQGSSLLILVHVADRRLEM